MERADVILDKIRCKERQLWDIEDEYRDQSRRIEESLADLGDRKQFLERQIAHEEEHMWMILNRFSAPRELASEFYAQIEELYHESQYSFRQREHQLLEEDEENKRNYRRQQDVIEQELQALRRDYASTNE